MKPSVVTVRGWALRVPLCRDRTAVVIPVGADDENKSMVMDAVLHKDGYPGIGDFLGEGSKVSGEILIEPEGDHIVHRHRADSTFFKSNPAAFRVIDEDVGDRLLVVHKHAPAERADACRAKRLPKFGEGSGMIVKDQFEALGGVTMPVMLQQP